MRVLGWTLAMLLLIFAGLCFVGSYRFGASLNSPDAKRLAQISVHPLLLQYAPDVAAKGLSELRGLAAASDLLMYVGLASAGLGILCLVIMAATHRRNDAGEDDDEDDDERMARIRRL